MAGSSNTICSRIVISVTYIFALLKLSSGATNEYGVLAAESSTEKENFCIIYFKEFGSLPEQKSLAKFHILQDDSKLDWCEDHPESDPKNKVVLLSKGNCSISIQALNIQERGGNGVFFITHSGKVADINVNDTTINITVGLISENSAERLKEMGNGVTVKLFAPQSLNFDFSLLIIWIIAMITISIGSYWSGHIRFAIYCKEMSSLPGVQRELPNKPSVRVNTVEESSLNVSTYAIGAFVLCMGLMLVLLYFLYDYLVYFIIGLFVLASILSVHSCLEPLVLRIKGSFCKSEFRCGGSSCHIDFRQVLLVAFAIAISVFWVVIRKEKHAWVLQDILGVAFCIHMLKSIRLPSLKICFVLLVLLFFYDIFFVFVTPYFTVKGESVMEEVATGGSSAEQLPMVLRVVHFGFDPLAVCYKQFSILGFGDILVPGLLISYCHGFDLVTSKKRIYFLTTVIMYGIGLLITFGALFLMSTAQPALLYLVPCTLIPTLLLGWFRGELSTLWKGFKVVNPTEASRFPDVLVAGNEPPSETAAANPSASPVDNYGPKDGINPSEGSHERTGERNYLLQ
ncbi:signal peptide peptidase-like 2B [Argiope bruennichi]|uniref:Signal peptide peptidase-like 2B like protein n=1 Tax=Argiope bruennichi TaxID=94029 RepID=A0A8T0E6R4_ARGBR|nr:signal peptide peptidase-like 2B [Argiope bruennichi]KAF8764894.1 Signal peptide peptidase-like 2B like protein [Argiope bruennichi]